MRNKFNFYSDGGHGWLKVKKTELKALGIEKEITGYSYMNNGNAYLEEDTDASLFAKKWAEFTGKEWNYNINTKTHVADSRSKIRRYACYEYEEKDLSNLEPLSGVYDWKKASNIKRTAYMLDKKIQITSGDYIKSTKAYTVKKMQTTKDTIDYVLTTARRTRTYFQEYNFWDKSYQII